MERFGRRGLLGLAGCFLWARSQAQPFGWPVPFEQTGITVEVANAANGVVARDLAYRKAMRRAWVQLRTALGDPTVRATDAEIAEMVTSLIVEEEHIRPRGYRGRLTVRFNAEMVEAITGLVPPVPDEFVEEVEEPE